MNRAQYEFTEPEGECSGPVRVSTRSLVCIMAFSLECFYVIPGCEKRCVSDSCASPGVLFHLFICIVQIRCASFCFILCVFLFFIIYKNQLMNE